MKFSEAVIAIPIYKVEFDENEFNSVSQCFKVLTNYPIYFIAPLNLNSDFYEKRFRDIKIKRFPDKYFMNIKGYNKLLLLPYFYNSFSDFKHMLIYQPDSWVFRDELNYWCKAGFDFIGSPWFDGFDNANIESKMIGVGNGGFSLRNISKAKRILYSFSYIVSPSNIFKMRVKSISNLGSLLKNIGGLFLDLTIRNNTFYLFNDFSGNEDGFWSVFAGSKFKWYKIPSPEEAMFFSFECNPSVLYARTNQHLPFGCHAWDKYDKLFWSKFIPVN